MCLQIIHLNIYIYIMYKEDLELNNLQWLMCHETQPNQNLSWLFLSLLWLIS